MAKNALTVIKKWAVYYNQCKKLSFNVSFSQRSFNHNKINVLNKYENCFT